MIRSLFALVVLLPLAAAAAPLANQLRHHPSPYLALHAADPVAWQEWGPAAVARARAEAKLLYLSIGYFSCHWCHVMQRESYRDAAIARFLNRHFIPVKVDRELDPALDQRLIAFAEKTRGRSGWPLNVFVTPDGHPLYATLYHPPQEFLQVIRKIDELWRTDRARLAELARIEDVQPTGPGAPKIDRAEAETLVAAARTEALRQADIVQGGFGAPTKFPQVPQLVFLLAELERRDDPALRQFLVLTLDAMAAHGLHDQLGGGFFRYTVDPSWTTPHFEKMLYDNAQLARLYFNAARVFGRDDYRRLARRTLDFMLREMRDPGGAFVASLSALDDRGVEGGYYLWSEKQLAAALTPAEFSAWRLHTGIRGAVPFDRGWLPLRALSVATVAERLKRPPAEVERQLKAAEDKLRAARSRRGLPRDTKVLAAWNGLALAAFVAGVQATNEPRYRSTAQAVRDVLTTKLWDGRQLERSPAGGRAALEDYAYVAHGLTAWAQLTGEQRDYEQAAAIARAGWQRFYGASGWRLGEDTLLVAETGQDVINDGPMPSPSAILIEASLALAEELDDDALRRQALAALNSGQAVIADNPFWHVTPARVMRAAAGEGWWFW
jgi:hypothetical protein